MIARFDDHPLECLGSVDLSFNSVLRSALVAKGQELMNLTFGCSHTFGIGVAPEDSWPAILKKHHGNEFINLAKGGTGFYETVDIAKEFLKEHKAEQIRAVVLQKPMPNRYPWFCQKQDFHRLGGVVHARAMFNNLAAAFKPTIAQEIFSAEKELMREFAALFPHARLAYWYYWGEYCWFAPKVLAVKFVEMGKFAETLGFDNLGTIVNGETLMQRGEAASQGDFQALMRYFFDEGWVVAVNDGHPTRKHNELVADGIAAWMDSKGLR